MKKAVFIVTILFVAVISTACINNIAVQELNSSAKSYMEKGDYLSAIERLESSLELDNTIYETHYNLGVAYIEAKQYEKAIKELDTAIRLNPKYANTYYTLAIAQENYADSLIEPNSESEIKTDDQNLSQDNDTSKIYQNLSTEIKEQMIEAYLSSITNYRRYAEIVNSNQKTEEINTHITEVEKVLSRLGYSGSSY